MKKVYKYKENRKLKVDSIYNFLVVNKITLPHGVKYFVLQDEFGEKHLIPARFYKRYNFNCGQNIRGRIDKINCQGQIIIEPQHPYFMQGNDYFFKFRGASVLISKKKGIQHYFRFVSETGEKAFLPYKPNQRFDKNKPIAFKVSKIKKAKIFIEKLNEN